MSELHPVFSALADPVRFAIVERLLARDGQTVGELSEPFDISAPAISRHLKVLEESGLIERQVERQFRVCRLRRECFVSIEDWLKRYRDFWNASFDRLDQYLTDENERAS